MSDSSKRGRAAEYRVAAYFLDQGHEVFWPASEGGTVDLETVAPDGTRVRVQVKRAYEVQAARKRAPWRKYLRVSLCSGGIRPRAAYTHDSFDLLAADADGGLWLIPVSEVIGMAQIDLERLDAEKRGDAKDWSRYRVR